MPAQTLTIEFPETAAIPQDAAWDQSLLRYGGAGALYGKGLLNRKEAERLTGDSGQVFEDKLRELGFRIQRTEAASGRTKASRWARVAGYYSSEEAGHLNGRSDEALEQLRNFRRRFEL